MDRVNTDVRNDYRTIVKELIRRYAAFPPSYGEIETETIFDEDNNHFELMYAGWVGSRRVHGSVLHIDLRNGKVWIQHDGIEGGVAEELVAAGIPRSDIVLAFHPPQHRHYTEYAVA